MSTGANNVPLKTWISGTFLGWLAGIALSIALSQALDILGIESIQFHLGLAMGLGVGFAQWLMLKNTLEVSAVWIVSSALSFTLPMLVLDLIPLELSDTKLIIGVVTGAAILAYWQYRNELQAHHMMRHKWVIGTLLGWVLATAPIYLINITMQLKGDGYTNLLLALLNLLLILSGGLILGLCTGYALAQKSIRKD